MNKTETLQRRAVQKKIKKAQDMTDLEFYSFAAMVLSPLMKNSDRNKIGIDLKFPYDLRASLDMKMFDCHTLTRWTAFMNNAGTLCHVVSPDAEILIRVKFTYPIKHLSDWHMLAAVTTRVEDYIKI